MLKPRSGVPLGGIGAGKVEWCPDGAFRNVTAQGNVECPIAGRALNLADGSDAVPAFAHDECGIAGAFLAAYVEGDGMRVLKERDLPGHPCLERGSIGYHGRFPIIDANFPVMRDVSLSMRAFSSLDLTGPDRHRNCAIPAAEFRLRAENHGTRERYVGLAFSWANIVGKGGYALCVINDMRGNTVRLRRDDEIVQLDLTHTGRKVDPRVEGSYTLSVAKEQGAEVSYLGWSQQVTNDPDHPTFAGTFGKDGRLPDTIAIDWGKADQMAALAVSRSLAPGESLEACFVLSWYFPHFPANGFPGIDYGKAYTRWFSDSAEVGTFMLEHRERLWRQTRRWQELIEESNLPPWFQEELMNDLFPVVSNTLWARDGSFSVYESPPDMRGCLGTIDQRAVAGAPFAMFFPDLARSELLRFGRQQVNEGGVERYGTHWDVTTGRFTLPLDRSGAIHHELGWDHLEGGDAGNERWLTLHWPDVTLLWVLQVAHLYQWTADREFLEEVAPRVRAAVDFVGRLDQDGDGIPELWGPGSCSYDSDAYPYYGVSSYVASVQVAALAAAQMLAREVGDEAWAAQLGQWCTRVAESVEARLWTDEDGGYFRAWIDPHHEAWRQTRRSHGPLSAGCTVSQLAGHWFLRHMGLGGCFDPGRVRRALSAISRHNVAPVRYCPADEWQPDGTRSQGWPYYTLVYFAGSALYEGLGEKAWEAVRRIRDAKYEADRSPWDAGLTWGGEENGQMRWGRWYMSNPASWWLLPALGGAVWDAPRERLVTRPGLSDPAELVRLPLFYPGFWLQLNASPERTALHVGQVDGPGLRIATWEVRAYADPVVRLNGARAPCAVVGSKDGMQIRFEPGIVLREGDRLEVSTGRRG